MISIFLQAEETWSNILIVIVINNAIVSTSDNFLASCIVVWNPQKLKHPN